MDQRGGREGSRGGKRVLVALLLGAFLSGAFSVASAQELPGRIRLGPVRVQPLFALKEEYSPNVFLTQGERVGEFTTTMSPGVRLATRFGRNDVELGWVTNVLRFSRFQNLLNTETHRADGTVNFHFPGGLQVSLSDVWRKDFAYPVNQFSLRRDYLGNDGNLAVSYAFADRWRVKVDPFVSQTKYHDDAFRSDNVVTQGVDATLYYRFLPRTSALVELRQSHDNQQNRAEGDASNYIVNVGLHWDAPGKLSGDLKGGWERKKYQDGLSKSTSHVETDVTFNQTTYTVWNLKLTRALIATSVAQGAAANGPYFTETGGNVTLRHYVTSRVVTNLSTGYFNDKYPDPDTFGENRTDKRFTFGGGVGYQPQEWLGAGLNYGYTNNNSTIKFYSYTDQRITFYVALAY